MGVIADRGNIFLTVLKCCDSARIYNSGGVDWELLLPFNAIKSNVKCIELSELNDF